MSASVDTGLDLVFAEALRFLTQELGAQRAAVLYDQGGPDMQVRAAEGLDVETFWTGAPISLSILRRCRAEGVPIYSSDAQEDPNFERSWSLDVSQIRSVMCVPYWGSDEEVAGVLYADCLARNKVFTKADFQHMMNFARDVEHRLAQLHLRKADPGRRKTRRMPAPAETRKVPRAPVTRAVPAAPEPQWKTDALTWWRSLAHQGVRRVELTVFFRSMATLFDCGVSLPRSVDLMARQAVYPPMRAALGGILRELLKGSALSAALAQHPELFSPLQARLVAVGEQGGSLGRILDRLAVQAEKSGHVQAQLRSALTYPLIVLALALVLVAWAHGVIFQGLQGLLGSLGADIPLPTRVLMLVGAVASRPWAVALVAAGAAGAAYALRRWSRTADGTRRIHEAVLRLPGIAPVVKAADASEYARALALCFSSGLPLLRAMELAEGVMRNVVLREGAAQGRRAVGEGRPIHKALAGAGFLSNMSLQMVAAGEESGHLEEMLERVARMGDEQVEHTVELASATLQPLLLLFVGLLVGFVVLATMAPMLKVVETL